MTIIKERCRRTRKSPVVRCVVRTDTYAKTLQHFLNLLAEARKDFPDLSAREVEVVHYGGRHYRGTFGIEFSAKKDEVPRSYGIIRNLELTL